MNKSLKMRRLMPAAGTAVVLSILFIIYSIYSGARTVEDIQDSINTAYGIERDIIEKIPMYPDYATPGMEASLRRFLLRYHLEAAGEYGVTRIERVQELTELSKSGQIVSIDAVPGDNHYFYNLKKNLRFLTPSAAKGLRRITSRFQDNLKKRGVDSEVKIAISSAVRPVSYQRKLRGRNANASIRSSHSYGISFDIFFDDYYVVLPMDESHSRVSEEIKETIRRRLGFLMGDALRSQLRSVLMDTLIEMQDEGLIYAILERKQRCYHVTVLGN